MLKTLRPRCAINSLWWNAITVFNIMYNYMSIILSKPPPRTPTIRKKEYGRYCIRAKALIINQKGETYVNITGYDTDISISDRVQKVADVKSRNLQLTHTDVEVVFLTDTTMLADGTIFLDYPDSGLTLTVPHWTFRS